MAGLRASATKRRPLLLLLLSSPQRCRSDTTSHTRRPENRGRVIHVACAARFLHGARPLRLESTRDCCARSSKTTVMNTPASIESKVVGSIWLVFSLRLTPLVSFSLCGECLRAALLRMCQQSDAENRMDQENVAAEFSLNAISPANTARYDALLSPQALWPIVVGKYKT